MKDIQGYFKLLNEKLESLETTQAENIEKAALMIFLNKTCFTLCNATK